MKMTKITRFLLFTLTLLIAAAFIRATYKPKQPEIKVENSVPVGNDVGGVDDRK